MNPSPGRALLIPFLVASLCSGCAALLNQVLWSRMLALVFGSTIEAVSAVTAIFMAGLALGSALGPALVTDRDRASAVSLYSRIETAIGAFALTLAFVLPALEPLRARWGAFPVWILALFLLVIPSSLMGTTLVVLSHVVSSARDQVRESRTAGLLFAANTFGAVAGAYGSVLLLVPALGVRRTIVTASILNLIAGAVARAWAPSSSSPPSGEADGREREKKRSKGGRAPGTAPSAPEPATAGSGGPTGLSVSVIAFALLAAGFAGLANEVAWTRAFILVAGPTVQAFAFVLGAIVLGLAAGALVSSALLPLLPDPRLAFSLVQTGVALASGAVIRSFAAMPLSYGEDVRRLVEHPDRLIALQAERSLLLLFPAAALSGALFPLGLRLLRSRFAVARAMGLASAINTFGAIAGAGLAGFIFLPALGLDRTLRLAAFASVLAAFMTALHCRRWPRLAALTMAGFAGLTLLQAPAFDQELFAGGAYKYSAYDTDLSVEEVLRRGELVWYAEGRVANVSVKRVGSTFSLAVDGKVDATSGGDMLTQRLLAHVPFLISEKPRRALVIGLGSGVTAAAALTHDPESVTAVEISPEVVEAARRFFSAANGRVLENPRLKLVVGDARQHVLATSDRYDVIISEPSNPWMAGVSALFTTEFFRSVRSRLAPGGVFCQWGHLYNMSEADLATLLATFRDVFPSSRVFLISEADILIVGGPAAPALSPSRLASIHPQARLDLLASGLSVPLLQAIPTVSLDGLGSRLASARRHTDDAPVLDFSAPLSMHAQTAAANRAWLLGDEKADGREMLHERLDLLEASGSVEWIWDLTHRALAEGLDDQAVLRAFVKSAVHLHRTDRAESALAQAIETAPSAPRFFGRALLDWNTARPAEALQWLEQASRRDPKDPAPYLLGAEIQSAAPDLPAMRQLVVRALALDPLNSEALSLAAEAELKDGRLEPAVRLAGGALNQDPKNDRALEVKALALAQLGRAEEARRSFEALLQVSPEASSARNNFGVFEMQQGNAAAAARLFEDAVDLDPSNLGGYQGLKEAALALNRHDLVQRAERGLARLAR